MMYGQTQITFKYTSSLRVTLCLFYSFCSCRSHISLELHFLCPLYWFINLSVFWWLWSWHTNPTVSAGF